MTIAEMRALLGLGSEVSDVEVVDAYAAYLGAQGPAAEPVTLEEAKVQLRLRSADTDEDDLIGNLIVAARELVEGFTGLVLTARTVVETRDRLEGWVDLHAWPIRNILSIDYLDAAGAEQTLVAGDYIGSLARRPVRMVAGIGKVWPRTAAAAGAVTVTLEAGFPTPADVPFSLRRAMLVLITSMYENRTELPEAVVTAASSLCRQHRRMTL